MPQLKIYYLLITSMNIMPWFRGKYC